MKNLVILLLSVALVVAAFQTRPAESSFRQHLAATEIQPAPTRPARANARSIATPETLPDGYTFADRLLWVEVRRGDQVAYTGAFGRWYENSSAVDPEETGGEGSDNSNRDAWSHRQAGTSKSPRPATNGRAAPACRCGERPQWTARAF